MTRKHLNRQVRIVAYSVIVVLIVALASKFLTEGWTEKIYDYIQDMSILIFTVASVFLANGFRKRGVFVESLRSQWHRIVDAKAELLTYIERDERKLELWLQSYFQLSRTIDSMRIVYRNVGETKSKIGRYPYEPLHDMRRAFESIDPRKGELSDRERESAKEAINAAFNAVRERFLDELELFEPTYPIIEIGSNRKKVSGYDSWRRDIRDVVQREEETNT